MEGCVGQQFHSLYIKDNPNKRKRFGERKPLFEGLLRVIA
jgi:hypothetical protein